MFYKRSKKTAIKKKKKKQLENVKNKSTKNQQKSKKQTNKKIEQINVKIVGSGQMDFFYFLKLTDLTCFLTLTFGIDCFDLFFDFLKKFENRLFTMNVFYS